MSGESFSIGHTQQKPVSKGNFTQEQKPQPGENRSGIKSYAELVAERQANRIASALAGVSAALNEHNGTTKDEDKGKTVSPEAIYRENILYTARVTTLVLMMREQELAMNGSNDARQLEETEGTNGVVKALATRAFVGGETDIDPGLWDRKIDEEEGNRIGASSLYTTQEYPANGNGDSSNVIDLSHYAARRAHRSAATATAPSPSPHSGYYSGRRVA